MTRRICSLGPLRIEYDGEDDRIDIHRTWLHTNQLSASDGETGGDLAWEAVKALANYNHLSNADIIAAGTSKDAPTQ